MPSHSPCSQCSQPVPPLKQFRFQTEERLLPAHNYFLTFSPFLQLLNYAELFSLLFFFPRMPHQCTVEIFITYSLYIYWLFSLWGRKWISCELSRLLTQPGAIHGLSRCCLFLNQFLTRAQYIYMPFIMVRSSRQLPSVLCGQKGYFRPQMPLNTFSLTPSLYLGVRVWRETTNAFTNSHFKALDLENREAI